MQIEFACPRCGNVIVTSSKNAGRQGDCSECQESVTVPPVEEERPSLLKAELLPWKDRGLSRERTIARYAFLLGGLSLAFAGIIFGPAGIALGIWSTSIEKEDRTTRWYGFTGIALGTVGFAIAVVLSL